MLYAYLAAVYIRHAAYDSVAAEGVDCGEVEVYRDEDGAETGAIDGGALDDGEEAFEWLGDLGHG